MSGKKKSEPILYELKYDENFFNMTFTIFYYENRKIMYLLRVDKRSLTKLYVICIYKKKLRGSIFNFKKPITSIK